MTTDIKDEGDRFSKKRLRGNLPLCRGHSYLEVPGREEELKTGRVFCRLEQTKKAGSGREERGVTSGARSREPGF